MVKCLQTTYTKPTKNFRKRADFRQILQITSVGLGCWVLVGFGYIKLSTHTQREDKF